MNHLSTILVEQYEGETKRLMDLAGYIKTEIFSARNGKNIKTAHFSDGTIIDSREGNFYGKFYKKCYNE